MVQKIISLLREIIKSLDSFIAKFGEQNVVTGTDAMAFGKQNSATGNFSVAGGLSSEAQAGGAVALGVEAVAKGEKSAAIGGEIETNNLGEIALGHYNVSHTASTTYGDAGNTSLSVGFGSGMNNEKNSIEAMQNGDVYVYGVGGYQGSDTHVQDINVVTLQTYLASLESRIETLED